MLDSLLEDAQATTALVQDTPRIPVAYLDEKLSIHAHWAERIPCAYLALGEGYASDLARARAAGWPTAQLKLGHLGMLRDAQQVARTLHGLLGQLDC